MKNNILFIGVALVIFGCTQPVTYDLVIQNAGLFDGYDERGVVNIAINADTIAAISPGTLYGDSVIDATGKFIIPGLVNAHVHASQIAHLQEGFPLGILTLLNMHTGMEDRELGWKQLTRDSAGFSTLYGSGHAATVPGGHPTQFSPDMETINDSLFISDWINHRMAKKVDYIKIIREHHEWMGNPPLPTLNFDQIEQLINEAHNKGYKAVIHANTVHEMVKIAEMGADGFVHMLDYKEDYPVPESYYKTLAENNVFVVTTGGLILKPMEGMPPFVIEWVEQNVLDATQRAEIIKKMHDYGILLVAGTDAQEGQMDFGEDYFLELELYKMAGLPNIEILKTATGNAAKAFDLPIGEIKPGARADMVMLAGNPIENIENLRKVEQVWKNGKAH